MRLEDYLREKYPDLTLTQAQVAFAEQVDSTRQTIDRYCRGQRYALPEMIARIRKTTRGLVTAEDLLPPEYRETERERRARA